MLAQQSGHRIDQARVDQGLVTLHIHHQIVVCQAQRAAGFSQSIAARRVVGSGEDGLHTMLLASRDDLGIVRGHHHLGGQAHLRLARHPHHHR